MYLKVEIEGTEKAYSFSDNQIVKIGRAPESEIQLLVEGISRSHLHVMHENGEYFVTDQGSTNGSFINGERLEPGVKAPFNSFFPVKLGFNVYLSLLDQIDVGELNNIVKKTSEENFNTKSSDKTRVLKINTENTNRTSPGRTNPKVKLAEVKVSKRPRKSGDGNFKIVLLLCVLGLGFYFSYLKWGPKIIEKDAIKPATVVESEKEEKEKIVSVEQRAKDLVEEKLMVSSLNRDKCLNDVEKNFCEAFKKDRQTAYYEGFYYFLGKLYLTIFESTLKKSYAQFELEEIEKREIILIARRKNRQNFDTNKFINKDLYRIQETNPKDKKLALKLMEVINRDYLSHFKDIPELKQFFLVVAVKESVEIKMRDYLELTPELYQKIMDNKDRIQKAIRFLIVTGYDLPFKAEMKALGL